MAEEKKKKEKKWIQGADIKEGVFTAKAKKKGITSAPGERPCQSREVR